MDGRQVRPAITWTPAPGMTERQEKKELDRQAALFEEQVRNDSFVDNRIKFEAFAQKYAEEFGASHLKAKTSASYDENLKKISKAIGHIKLCDLKPTHINLFYKNLQEAGVRNHTTATCKRDIGSYLKDNKITMAEFSKRAGVAASTVRAARDGNRIALDSAVKISAAMGEKVSSVFLVKKDMTPLSAASVLSCHRTLSAILSKAVKWGYLKTNPADRADKPKLGRHEAAYLEEADAKKLLALLQDEPIKWRAIITFDLLSGLRRAEVLGLRWTDVDLDNNMIQIRQTSNYLPGKGVYTETPKNATSRRPLKLARVAILLLLEYKEWQDAQRKAVGDAWAGKDGRVFTTDTGTPIFPDSVTAWFSRFVKRTGLPKVTVHSMRHTYASLMIADGTPLVLLANQLGHAQVSTTSNIYSHVIASAEAKAQTVMDDKFKDIVGPKTKKTAEA